MEPAVFEPVAFDDHQVLDSGDGAKLERFGDRRLVRPDPQALWPASGTRAEWERADLVFHRESDRGGQWQPGPRAATSGRSRRWTVEFPVDGARRAVFEIEPTPFKHVGLFPEQATNWRWVAERRERLGERPRLLNLFGYTGAASVTAALAGYDVTHVDASKVSLDACVRNAEASGLGPKPFRVLLEDASAFVEKERRRERRYDAVLLDPPHYGRGPKGQKWELERGLAPLLEGVRDLLAERALCVLSTYAVGHSPLALANLMAALGPGKVEAGELVLPESGGRLLPCGFCARFERGL
ncbi:MAG: SAM-dependent methyltransferase [Planctomycetota bacterium]